MEQQKIIEMKPMIGHNTTIYEAVWEVLDDVEKMEKIKAKREKFIAEEMPRLVEKYGDMTVSIAEKVAQAEKHIAECVKCQELPCQRAIAANCTPSIRIDEKFGVDIRHNSCRYYLMQDRQKAYEGKFKIAKIPLQYRDKTFSDYEVNADNSEAVKAAKEFLENPKGGMFFFGDPGTGKTFLSAIIAQEFVKKGHSVIFGDVPSLLDDLKSTFDSKNKSLDDLMESLTTADLLVLDDLGTESPTDWAVERIYLIINQRYNAEKPLIVTSNFKLSEVGQRLNEPKKSENKFPSVTGKRIVSRLAQMCKRIEIKGRDRRI